MKRDTISPLFKENPDMSISLLDFNDKVEKLKDRLVCYFNIPNYWKTLREINLLLDDINDLPLSHGLRFIRTGSSYPWEQPKGEYVNLSTLLQRLSSDVEKYLDETEKLLSQCHQLTVQQLIRLQRSFRERYYSPEGSGFADAKTRFEQRNILSNSSLNDIFWGKDVIDIQRLIEDNNLCRFIVLTFRRDVEDTL